MTLSEIQQNEELRHREFPVTRDRIYLAHAAVSPLPARVAEAIHQHSLAATLVDQEAVEPAMIAETRQLAAAMIQARPEEIAFVGPTSLALSYVAAGLSFRRTDNIVIYFDDYPSNVYPWMALAEKGVQVRLLNVRGLGRIRPIDVIGQVDENTRLVALASAHFISGYRVDIDAIGKHLRARKILFCVDAIQTLGAFPVSVEHVDFLAADAHKWLLGPCAAGLLYVRKEAQQHLRPVSYGWHNVASPNYVAQEKIVFRSDARRYEAGSANLLGLAGLRASLKLLAEVGVENIATDLQAKREWLASALTAKGFTVLQGDAPREAWSGMVTFHHDGDMAELHQRLERDGVTTSLRLDRDGKKYIRLSPHFYNTSSELQRVIDLL